MSVSGETDRVQENDLEGVGPIIARERFENATVHVDKGGNRSTSLLKEATSPDNEFEIETEFEFEGFSADPRERIVKANYEVSILNQDVQFGFRSVVRPVLDYEPFNGNSSILSDISWEADEREIQDDLDGFKENLEKELLEGERKRYKAASSALEELKEAENDIEIEGLAAEPAGNEVSFDFLEAVLNAARDYDPSETFEDIYDVERDRMEGDKLVSNILEFEYLQDNPEDVLAEDLSKDGFSNRAERILRELDPQEANSIVEEAVEDTDEIKSVYTDCWGNTMAVYQDNSRSKLVDSEVREESDENGHSLDRMIEGAKEEFSDEEYIENTIDEVVAGDYDKDVETWFATDYLPENMDKIDSTRTMAKANALLFDNLHRELKEEDYEQDSEASNDVEEFTNEPIYWSSHGSEDFDYEELEEDQRKLEDEGALLDSVRSIATSYLKS